MRSLLAFLAGLWFLVLAVFQSLELGIADGDRAILVGLVLLAWSQVDWAAAADALLARLDPEPRTR